MKAVLFAWVQNPGRSQRGRRGSTRWRTAGSQAGALCAGAEPGTLVHQEAIQVMREPGMELQGFAPQKLTEDLPARCATWITMACGEACAHVSRIRRLELPLDNRKRDSVARVREIRDAVKSRLEDLREAEGWR